MLHTALSREEAAIEAAQSHMIKIASLTQQPCTIDGSSPPVSAGENEELQSVLNAALSRLEAAIGAAQSQEARVASLVEQASLDHTTVRVYAGFSCKAIST